MITQLSAHLSFDADYVSRQRQQNEDFYESKDVPVGLRSWALGLIQRSDRGPLNTLTGRSVRTPGEYHATDPDTGKPEPRKLANTCEFIHPSVRWRMDHNDTAIANSVDDKVGKGKYKPAALDLGKWEFVHPGDASDVGGKQWHDYGKWKKRGETTFIIEERIEEGTAEMKLVEGWPGVVAELSYMDAA